MTETDYTSGLKTTYTYNNAGNITQKRIESLSGSTSTVTVTYTYGDSVYGDRLTSYNGESITYDSYGRTSKYRGKNIYYSGYNAHNISNFGNASFTYYEDGMRRTKTVGGVTHNYTYDGLNLIREEWNGNVMIFLYDAAGSVVGMQYRNSSYATGVWDTYYYEKNLQGDVIAIYSASGTKLVSYTYDAWGNFTRTDVASSVPDIVKNNPITYRGYYYDYDLELYYLSTRYYDPETCRFVTADYPAYLGANGDLISYNLYAYCSNNPVMYVDPTGHAPDWNKLFMGSLLVFMGVVSVAAVVSTGGSCAPLVAAGYALLGTAGTVTATIGAAEVYESFTDDNPVMDYTGEDMYNTLKYGSLVVISMGSAIVEVGTTVSVCFVEGTPVKSESGTIPIESIVVGEKVFAYNEQTGEMALKAVVNTFVNEATELVHVFTGGEEIICTNEHPFYSPVKGWISACKLRAGDILLTLNGDYIVVEQVAHEILEAPIKVYNFEVEDFHTYFVGDGEGVLVHNSCNHNSSWNAERRNYWKMRAITDELDHDYGAYKATANNIKRMRQGLAPKGWDRYSVQLHHPNGILNDFYNYYPVSRTFHIFIHSK